MDARAFVQRAVDLHMTLDVDKVMDLFDDEVEATWNGEVIARNKAELTAWYRGFYSGIAKLDLKKTLRVADGTVMAVEWSHWREAPDGKAYKGAAAEVFWLNGASRLVKWHAHCTETEVSGDA